VLESEVKMADTNPAPGSSPSTLEAMQKTWQSYDNDAKIVAVAMGAALFIGCIVAAAGAHPNWLNALLWSGACSAIGWIVGFLFGIPRSLASDDQGTAPKATAAAVTTGQPGATTGQPAAAVAKTKSTVRANTNLEQISDWLTKIIVGVTLVQLQPALGQLEKAATVISTSLGGALSFAYALMLYFSITGFLGSYLLTRLFLQKAFREADSE
jgi:hypothetical protein